MIIGGVEEAGRGPVIGPMVIAIAVINEEDEFKLKALGVKDSKLLTPSQRERLYNEIKDLCEYELIKVGPEEIDNAVNSKDTNLNWLEADKAVILINKLRPDKVILDCPSTNLREYKKYIQSKLEYQPKLVVEHKADVKYAIVGAASILAKVCRDKEIKKLKAKYKVDFGSGYPSDPLTVEFTKRYYDKYPFFRQSWETWQKAKKLGGQRKLEDF
ncbi:MAG TPA: ribonuclease HII [Candidatus Woesearchaeota archaeon]|nr:ribonuclease HII [Candidatus Woesearchaeota archaeon]